VRKILVLIAMLGATCTATWAQDNLAGDWVGEMNTGFKVRLHFENSGSKFTGKLINPSGNETALDVVDCDGTHLHFAVNNLNLSYEGVWDAKGKIWTGKLTFQQEYSFTLKRATAEEPGQNSHRRPQEDAIRAAMATYTERNVRFSNAEAGNQLAGTLTVPDGKGPFPGVVLVSGTGHNTRDEEVFGHEVFLVLADLMSRAGLAVLRYDKRGVGGSTGDYDSATTADFATDAEAAVRWLRTQPQIDATRVGILGHSEGGIIAPMVAAEDKTVAFVIMIAGPCIRGDRLFVLQSAATAKAYGAPEEYIARRRVFDQDLYDVIIAAPSDAAALERAKPIVAQGVAEKIIDPAEAVNLAQEDTRRWYRYFIAYDPAPALAKLTVPVLVLNGSLDVQVPAKENLLAAREALKGNTRATILELPGMNHLLQDAKSGAPNEYDGIEETISPAAQKIIVDWLARFSGR
jgi:pimeloyl-ACP methyl ester carboxylesterase